MIDSGSAIAAMTRRAHIAQEQEDDDDRQRRALEQRMHRRVVIALGIAHRGVDQLERDLGMGRARSTQCLLDLGGDASRRSRPWRAECRRRRSDRRSAAQRSAASAIAAATREVSSRTSPPCGGWIGSRGKFGESELPAGLFLRGLDLRVRFGHGKPASASATGSSATEISRVTPPIRSTQPTPASVFRPPMTLSSTKADNCSGASFPDSAA